MHEFCFSDVALPNRQVVLELPLLDFCIGHRLLLLRQRNPLLWQTEADFNLSSYAQQLHWLIEAVYVCAQSFAGRQGLEKAPTRWRLWCNARRVQKWHRLRRQAEREWARLQAEAGNLAEIAYLAGEVAKFRNYLAEARVVTDFEERREGFPFMPTSGMQDAEAGRALGGPYDAALIQYLVQELHLSHAEALEFPLGLAQAHYLGHLERTGNLRILNALEFEFKEQNTLRDQEAAEAAGFATVAEHVADGLAQAKAAEKEKAEAHG